MENSRIVIVEDEQDMADLVAMRLRRENYTVEIAKDGREGLNRILSDPPDLVVLDLMLPRMTGTDVAAELRANPKTAKLPILMLTAKSEESDVVLGLHVGADDYVTKPFNMSVLVARIGALLRRAGRDDEVSEDVLTAGPIRVDRERHRVEVDGEPISLTLTEFRLLAAIISARGRVLSRNQLIDQALGMHAVVTDRTIDVHMAALRRKLGKARTYIRTVRGIGYRLADRDESED